MKTTTTLVLMTLISILGFSQETISNPAININDAVILSVVCKNDVSSTMTAHTYKLNTMAEMNVEESNTTPQTPNTVSVDSIIDQFLAVSGVSECTFDKATQTFTILSEPATNLFTTVKNINEN